MAPKVVRYSVVVPEAMIHRYPVEHLNRAAHIINTAPIENGGRERLTHLHAVRYTGRAPSRVVTLLAAMAQGHPLAPILDEFDDARGT